MKNLRKIVGLSLVCLMVSSIFCACQQDETMVEIEIQHEASNDDPFTVEVSNDD